MCGADRVVTMDLHAAQVQGFLLETRRSPFMQVHCSANMRGTSALLMKNLVVVSPDAGSAKRARAYANILGCNVAIGDKGSHRPRRNPNALGDYRRCAAKPAWSLMISQSASNTLCKVAYGLMDKGAKNLCVPFPCDRQEDAVKRIEESPIKMLVTTDTVDNTDVLKKFKKKIKLFPPRRCLRKPCAPFTNVNPMAMFEHLPARLMEMSFEDTDK